MEHPGHTILRVVSVADASHIAPPERFDHPDACEAIPLDISSIGDGCMRDPTSITRPMLTATHAESLALKAKLFRGFADPSRLSFLEALREGARSVSEIVELTSLTQPNASNQLACLLDCGLVEREARGRFAYSRLTDERVGNLLGFADEILTDVAQGVHVCLGYEGPDGRGERQSS